MDGDGREDELCATPKVENTDINKLTVVALRKRLGELGLMKNGNKTQLVNRLRKSLKATGEYVEEKNKDGDEVSSDASAVSNVGHHSVKMEYFPRGDAYDSDFVDSEIEEIDLKRLTKSKTRVYSSTDDSRRE